MLRGGKEESGADFCCCNHKMDNIIQMTATDFKDAHRQNSQLTKPVSILNKKQALANEIQQGEARRRQ
jgi:hypothetical protein